MTFIPKTPMPSRIAALPVDGRGYPVPWFVARVNGVPDFRVADAAKFIVAVKQKRCWVCGEQLGRMLAFPIGPMCIINRTISEPPCHFECAKWSVENCPFLVQPKMVRNDDNMPAGTVSPGGYGLKRNPGAVCIWVTRSFEIFSHKGKALFTIGEPESVSWWREGRPATRPECEEAIDSGVHNLMAVAQAQGDYAVQELGKYHRRALNYLPAETVEASS